MAVDRISIRLPRQLAGRLQRLVRSTGRSESDLVREALEDYCRRQTDGPSCYDLALKTGIIGCASELPHDLSTNPKHMDGFGQ